MSSVTSNLVEEEMTKNCTLITLMAKDFKQRIKTIYSHLKVYVWQPSVILEVTHHVKPICFPSLLRDGQQIQSYIHSLCSNPPLAIQLTFKNFFTRVANWLEGHLNRGKKTVIIYVIELFLKKNKLDFSVNVMVLHSSLSQIDVVKRALR